MSPQLVVILMFGSMMLLLMTGRQIFAIVGGVAGITALMLWGTGGIDIAFLSGWRLVQWFVILSIPLFVFMGLTLSRSGVADNLYEMIHLWLGHIPGGLGMGTIGVCAVMASMSGLNICATVTAATIALPSMLKRKYDKLMVTGLVQAGGALGFLIPPSMVLIVYGLIGHVSIGHLWLAAVLPGIMLAAMLITYIGIRCRLQPKLAPSSLPEERGGWGEKFRSLRSGILPIILVSLVLGLLFMGVTSLLECAAIGAAGALVCAAINRRLTKEILGEVLDDTLVVTSMIMWIFMTSMFFGAVFDGLGATDAMASLLTTIGGTIGGGPWGIIWVMQATFFLLGMFLDDAALLIIVAPLYIPLVAELGFSLVWFGILYVLNMQMAFLTPPFGYNLFIMKGIIPKVAPDSGITMADIYRSVIPFVGVQGAALALIMIFPQIALWLPNLVMEG